MRAKFREYLSRPQIAGLWVDDSSHEEKHPRIVVPDEEEERVVDLEVLLAERTHPIEGRHCGCGALGAFF